jgi:hypothetical protein
LVTVYRRGTLHAIVASWSCGFDSRRPLLQVSGTFSKSFDTRFPALGHPRARSFRLCLRRAGECLVLGDNLIVLPGQAITDDWLSQVGQQYRRRYRERLQTGHGYDQEHRDVLRDLQAEQARHRNQPGGYWIAEADPTAADQAFIVRKPIASTPWAILASDGAYKPMTHLGLADWPSLGTANDEELELILSECQRWEEINDPNGQKFPRAKRHDDKTLAVAGWGHLCAHEPAEPRQLVDQRSACHSSALW